MTHSLLAFFGLINKLVYSLIAASLILFTHLTGAVVITTADGNGADAHVVSNTPNDNFGDVEFVAVKNDSGNNIDRKGYFRFDLSNLGTVSDGSLNLVYVNQTGASAIPSTYNIYGLIDGDTGELWDESGITWNNAPANITGSGNAFDNARATLLGMFSINVTTAVFGDVITITTPEISSFLQADTNQMVTFMVSRNQLNFANEWFSSKESLDFGPAFVDVSTAAGPVSVPAGGVVWLFGSGLLGLIGIAHRKTA